MASKLGNWNRVRGKRLGIMLHYDGSASDAGAKQWLMEDERCKLSYNWLVLDTGEVVEVAPYSGRAWHAGTCRSSDPKRLPYTDANSAFFGIAIAATIGQTATEPQKAAVAKLCREIFEAEGWSLAETWRIVSHKSEAWPRDPENNKWRKVDIDGTNPSKPVMSLAEIRRRLAA